MKRVLGSFCALMLAAPMVQAAGPVDIDLQVGGWQSTISGEVNNAGTAIDVENTLGLDDATSAYARARLDVTALGNFYFGYTPLTYDATKTLTNTITFGGATYSASTSVQSEVDLSAYDVAWTASLINAGIAEFELGLNVKMVDGVVTLNNGTTSRTADLTIPVPMVKAVLRVDGPFVSAELDGSAIGYGGNTFSDVTAQVKLSPMPLFYLSAGYRAIDLELEDGNKYAFVKSSGPFMAVGFEF